MASKISIVRDAVRRFHHLPARTIARHIMNTHGDLFENDLEKIRGRVRYVIGQKGKHSRESNGDPSLFRDSGSVKMPKTWIRKTKDYHLDPGLWLIMSDIHVPFHEIAPIEAAVQYGQANKVDGILFNGDIQDCAAVSYWKQAKRDFNAEVEAVVDFFDWMRQEFPTQKFVYKPGNHEYRLPRYYLSNAPELVETPLAAMETLIGFEERKIEFLDYFQKVRAGLLPIIHGHEMPFISKAVNAARGLFNRAKSFSLCSHCHTTSEHTAKTINGDLMTCWSVGCMCDLEPEYSSLGNDWNWGFALVNVEKSGSFEVENKRVMPGGKVK